MTQSKPHKNVSNADAQTLADRLSKLPGASPEPIVGRIGVEDLGPSMPSIGPLFPEANTVRAPGGEVTWQDIDMVTVDYLTDAKSVAAVLTEGQTTVPIPGLDGYSLVKFIWGKYRTTSFGTYNELIVVTPSVCADRVYSYVPLIYVTNDSAMAGGREADGFPKKIAEIDLIRAGDRIDMTFARKSARASASLTLGSKLFSSPLPAKEPVNLDFPYNMTLPLPAPTGTPQKVSLDWLAMRFFPDAPLAQLVGLSFEMDGDCYGARDVSFAMHGSEDDPFHLLPVLEVLGGSAFFGTLTLRGSKWLAKELPGAEKLVRDLR